MTVISLDAAREKLRRLQPAPHEFTAAAALDRFDAGHAPFADVLQALVAPFQEPPPGRCVQFAQRI